MNEKNNKRWGRRLVVGLLALAHVDFFFFYGVAKGCLEWSYKYALLAVGIALFVGGFLTVTDFINGWKK